MNIRNYAIVNLAYCTFTLTDGALRMLVLLHFHELGYSPLAVASLFLLYEFMGIITNLLGGWVGAHTGLNRTLMVGLALQVFALTLLAQQQISWSPVLSVAFVMSVQAVSGIAKDLTKMSAKSATKFAANDNHGELFRLVALVTGSKNAVKGVGFFVGAVLLTYLGFTTSLYWLASALAIALVLVVVLLDEDIGRSTKPPALRSIFAKSTQVNQLAIARLFLFGARDTWFAVALPIYLAEQLAWSFEQIGAYLAAWVIGYGIVQSAVPRLLKRKNRLANEAQAAAHWALALSGITAVIASLVTFNLWANVAVVCGLIVFGIAFAFNSSLHSFLIVAYAARDNVTLDVGFYYSANACGRLIGTFVSGLSYLWGGMGFALWSATAFIFTAWLLSIGLPAPQTSDERLVKT